MRSLRCAEDFSVATKNGEQHIDMANGKLTYDDFLQRLDIQDILMDAGYHLNKRDG